MSRQDRRRAARRLPRPTREQVLAALVVCTTFAVGYLTTVRTLELFAPDTRYYAGMALWYGGTDQDEAARQVAEYSAQFGWKSPDADVLFGWGLVQPRVVLPALAMPFVKLFGIPGIAVVTGAAMFLLVASLTVVLARRYGLLAALIPVVLICVSPRLMFYGSAMLTESLTALWGVFLLALAWRYAERPSHAALGGLVAVTVLASFTRQATLIPAGAMVMVWFLALLLRQDHRRWRAQALTVGATAVGIQLLQTWLFPSFSQLTHFKRITGQDTLLGALRASPDLARDIVGADVRTLAAIDHPLLLLLVLALLSMVVLWRRPESHMLLGALIAYELYNITNGTPTQFRYGMPGLAFVAASIALLVSETVRSATRDAATTDPPDDITVPAAEVEPAGT